MTVNQIIDHYNLNQIITPQIVYITQDSENLGKDLVAYLRNYKNRPFALAFLQKITELRKTSNNDISGDTVMLGCYLLGLHGAVEDCVTIWNAKNIDFDAGCYVDIQLAVFAGVNKTIAYLSTQTSDDAKSALKYITECNATGDFDTIDNYFNPQNTPWFV